MSLSAGSRLGSYEIVAPIGAGGMGEVYKARDGKLDRLVAVKVLPESLASDPDLLARFEREAKAVAALSHPGILGIHDFGRDGERTFAVMELLEGETLRDKLAGGALPAKKAVDLALQIAHALAAAHEKGIVHRDLKPENLFVTKDGRAKVLDFGLAKQFAPKRASTQLPTENVGRVSTEEGVVLGTVGYMSPEQVRGEPADQRADIFAFGAVLHEMLTGVRAFARATTAETMVAILKEDPPEIAEGSRPIPAGVKRVVEHCLEKEAAHRFQNARDLAFALESGSLASGVSGPALAGAPRVRSRRWAWPLVSAAAAAAVTALVLHRPPPAPLEYTRLTYKLGVVRNGRFSPDGRTVFYSASWDGGPPEVYAVNADGSSTRSLGNPGAVVRSVSAGGDVAVGTNAKEENVGEMTLAILPKDGGAAKELVGGVHSADFTPDGSELAVARFLEKGRDLELPIGTKLYESPGWLFGPRVSPDGRRVAVFESSGIRSSVLVFDRSGKKKVLATDLQSGFPGLAWSPDGREVWLSHFTAADPGHRKTWAIDERGTMRLLSQDPSLPDLLDVARDGRALYTRSIQRVAARIKPPGETAERELGWLDGTRVADLSADGRTLVFGEGMASATRVTFGQAGFTVFLTSTAGGLPTKLGSGNAGRLSADGTRVFGNTGVAPQKAVLFPTGAGQPRILETPGLAAVLAGTLLGDGREAAVVGREPGGTPKLYVVDVATGRHRHLADAEKFAASFDGREVAYGERDELVISSVADGAKRSVAKLARGETPIRFALDGRSVYLNRVSGATVTGEGFEAEIDRCDLATGAKTPWKRLSIPRSATALGFVAIAIAPEADAYAYSYAIQQASDLFIVKGLR